MLKGKKILVCVYSVQFFFSFNFFQISLSEFMKNRRKKKKKRNNKKKYINTRGENKRSFRNDSETTHVNCH